MSTPKRKYTIDSSTVGKKRKILTLEEKVCVIEQSEKVDSSRVISPWFGVGKTQITKIIQQKSEIMNQWTSGLEGSRKHLKVRKCLYPDINDKVYEWFVVARSKNIPVSGPLIKEKALILSLELGYDDFSVCNGWLDIKY